MTSFLNVPISFIQIKVLAKILHLNKPFPGSVCTSTFGRECSYSMECQKTDQNLICVRQPRGVCKCSNNLKWNSQSEKCERWNSGHFFELPFLKYLFIIFGALLKRSNYYCTAIVRIEFSPLVWIGGNKGHYWPEETTDEGSTRVDAGACAFLKLIINRQHDRIEMEFLIKSTNQLYINNLTLHRLSLFGTSWNNWGMDKKGDLMQS